MTDNYTYTQSFETYMPSELGFATWMIDHHGDRLRYALDTDHFYRYTGTHWKECTRTAVEVRQSVIKNAEYIKARMIPKPDKDDPLFAGWTVQAAFVKLASSSHSLSGVIHTMKAHEQIWCKMGDFSANPYLINFQDCTVDVRKPWCDPETDEPEFYVHPHDPKDMLSSVLKYKYPAYHPEQTPLWDAMLLHMCGGDESYARSLEQSLAYGLIGENPEQLMVFLVGEPNIGKTQALEIVAELAGSSGGHGKVELIQKTYHDHDSVLAELRGKNFIVLGETSHRIKLDDMKFKDVTGARYILTRKLHQEPVPTRVTWTLYCSTNDLPEVPGEMDDAVARRMWVFKLPGQPIPKDERDVHLTEKILRQEGEAILYRFAKYLSEWYACGNSPEQHAWSIMAKDSYQASSNTVAAFCEICLHPADKDAWVSYDDLANAYGDFCKKRNLQPVSRSQLPKRIVKVMMTPERDSNHGRMKGIAINFEAPSWL